MTDRKSARPIISAVGAVSALGRNWDTTWRSLLRGQRHLTPYSSLCATGNWPQELQVAACGDLHRTLGHHGDGAAARLAEAALHQVSNADERLTVYGGSNHGETDLLFKTIDRPDQCSPTDWRAALFDPLPNVCGSNVRWHYGSCASASIGLFIAIKSTLSSGRDTIVLGVDALSEIAMIGFNRVGALSRAGCRPFHTSRDGLLMGEGAAAARLTLQTPAQGRNIAVLGCATSCDAGHPTDPDPSGTWLGRAIDAALEEAGARFEDIGAVVCHGTGTPKNDAVEAAQLAARWPARGVPITSVKGAIGHTMGAAGLFNLLVATESSRSGLLPPTVSDGSSILDGVDLVRDKPRPIQAGATVLSLVSGFGGNNVACVVGVAP